MVHKGTQHLSNELLLMMSGTLREVGEVGLPCVPGISLPQLRL